jgi:hypothetical protein
MRKTDLKKVYRNFVYKLRQVITADDNLEELSVIIGCTVSTLTGWLETSDYNIKVSLAQVISICQHFEIGLNDIIFVPEENHVLINLRELMDVSGSGSIPFEMACVTLAEYMSQKDYDMALELLELAKSGDINIISGEIIING